MKRGQMKTHAKAWVKGHSACGLIGLPADRFADDPTCKRCAHIRSLDEKYRREADARHRD